MEMTRRGPRVVSARARATTVAMIPRRRNDTIDDMVDRKLLAEMRGCVPAARRNPAVPSRVPRLGQRRVTLIPAFFPLTTQARTRRCPPRGRREERERRSRWRQRYPRLHGASTGASRAPKPPRRPVPSRPRPTLDPSNPRGFAPRSRRASVRAPDVFPKPPQRAGRPGARSDQPPNLHPAQGPGPGRRGEGESRAPREAPSRAPTRRSTRRLPEPFRRRRFPTRRRPRAPPRVRGSPRVGARGVRRRSNVSSPITA